MRHAVRFVAETDSLNSSILAPDVRPGMAEFDLFIQEVAREMTAKAGQKCTAIRKALVPRDLVAEVVTALQNALAKVVMGDPRVEVHGPIPLWGRIFLRVFGAVYFALNFGVGAFLFTTRQNFLAIGGFDEQFFAGEEVYFTMALKKHGRFKLLREPIVTSGRKLRLYWGRAVLGRLLSLMLGGPRTVRSRERLGIWYDGKREGPIV
jgi:hypothetical protein